MCRAVTCKTCGKTTWAGCGQHIDSVKSKVAAGQWCDGRHEAGSGSAKTVGRSGGFFKRLFGRGAASNQRVRDRERRLDRGVYAYLRPQIDHARME